MKIIAEKVLKKKPSTMQIIFALAAFIMFSTIVLLMNAKSMGTSIGTGTGSAVGRAIGSLEGITKGRAEGSKAGKKTGLSAEDTEARISSQLHQIENLEVLVASVKLSDFHSIGEENSFKYYAALYLVNGNVIFTVDMNQAKIALQSDGLHITLPKPVGTLYLDDSSVQKVGEYQTKLFDGDAESGFDAYLNTMAKMQEASEETLDNYDVLIASAKNAAERQVTLLAKSVSTTPGDVHITFTD